MSTTNRMMQLSRKIGFQVKLATNEPAAQKSRKQGARIRGIPLLVEHAVVVQ